VSHSWDFPRSRALAVRVPINVVKVEGTTGKVYRFEFMMMPAPEV
jgi:hypothetical protein